MFFDNKMISPRQGFRMGILENITLGMVIIPYITTNLAGQWHFGAFLLGLLFGGIYMAIIYYLSTRVPEDVESRLDNMGILGSGVSILYVFRFVLRAGIILLFFGKTLQEYLLQSFSLWVIIICFVLVCGYGAARDIEKRGRMLELLFPWMVVPIVLVAVFSISSISLRELYDGLMGVNYSSIRENVSVGDVVKAAYVTFLVTTSSELMLFTLPSQKERNWRNALKTGIWIVISLLLAYVFIIGILGGHWVSSDSQAALNVMEAAFVPGGVIERADYPVIAFWIIGVFAILSGYIFFAKEAFLIGTKLKHKKQGRIGLLVIMLMVVLVAWVWSLDNVAIYLAEYMLWADVLISLIIPALGLLRKKGINLRLKKATMMLLICVGALALGGCQNEKFKPIVESKDTIENRDFVTNLTFEGDREITFTTADIKKYLSDATGSFETKDYKCEADSLNQGMEKYYEENGRRLDLGHISGITFKQVEDEVVETYIIEISNMSQMGKSITVTIDGEEKKEITLRDLIKKIYAGEDFP